MAVQLFAAIDVGSFELEMGIYEISSKSGLRQVDHIRHVIPLGKETYSEGKIRYELVDEMCRVLKEFSDIMKSYKVKGYRAYATSAMREAKNNRIILDQIRVRTGLTVRIISNSEQRFLSYKAIASKAAQFHKIIQQGTAIVEVGFGSAQVSLFDKDALVSTQNLPLGSLWMREMLAAIPAGSREHLSQIEEIVDNELMTFQKMYLKNRQITNLIAIGENILYLVRQMGTKTTEQVDASVMMAFYERFSKMTLEQIEEKFGATKEYASLLLPTMVVYKRILELTGAKMFWIPKIRLCDGIAADYAEGAGLVHFSHNFENDILAASRNMAKRYKCQHSHGLLVEDYSLRIFDCMKKFHGMGERERLLLQIAVILHSCGKFVSMSDSSECSYQIIMSTEIIGLSHLEREIIANVVRYNIREFDYDQVELEAATGAQGESILMIAKLTAILRLANAMDRAHRGKLADCRMNLKDGEELVITTGCNEDLALERLSFEQKARFFEEIFGIRPVLRQKRRRR